MSTSDLVGHLNCLHLTELDLAVAKGTLTKPQRWDPLLEILRERGRRHEAEFVEHLRARGLTTVEIGGVDITPQSVDETLKAMQSGAEVIIQAALRHDRWSGRADILRRVETPSKLGAWSYEIVDTKLARETKGGTVLQLCLYADLLEKMQGKAPEYVYVVAPWTDFEPQCFRFADYAAYYRRAKAATEDATESGMEPTYPEPKEHCDVCRWQDRCENRWRDDDHLCLVAGVTRNQTGELQAHGISTVAALAAMPSPMPWKPQRGARESYEKARDQARMQIASRDAGELQYELLPVEPPYGLCMLPEPCAGDVFFDIESDQFVGEHGLEYLFGYIYRGDAGDPVYVADWAFDREGERAIFERFIDFVTQCRAQYPDLHIYHFASYESGAIKRLMGRYASREDEVDNLLRGKVFVDLLAVVRNATRVGVESYSTKKLEPLYGFERQTALKDANIALSSLSAGLELGDVAAVSCEDRAVIQGYNKDDCASTAALRDWLEARRAEFESAGTSVPRPEPGQDGPSEELGERQERIRQLVERLTSDIPADPEERSREQQARWILAFLLDWHRREQKATWWEYFRLKALTTDELVDERAAVANLTFVTEYIPPRGRVPVHRYVFPQQDADLRVGDPLCMTGGDSVGSVHEVSTEHRTIDIKKSGKSAAIHPAGVYKFKKFDHDDQADSLLRLGEYVAENGILGNGPLAAARGLLLNEPPLPGCDSLRLPGEASLDAAKRVVTSMDCGVFPIQGPPGAGKSYTGARVICYLVSKGKKVGITANSHKVIRGLLDEVLKAATEMEIDLRCIQKPESGNKEEDQERLIFAKNNRDVFAALASSECQVAGGTSFLWSPADAEDVLDVLVVDEAAQMSLANVVAVAQSARTLVLLGDPQQLDQPTQGTHPDGAGVSSLEHVLGSAHTISADRGLFLEKTWRLHPEICEFNSELFYDGKLTSEAGCAQQRIISGGPINGSGLRYLPVEHAGNMSASIEEANAIFVLVRSILEAGPRWIDREGIEKDLRLEDILIITPYNAQVFGVHQRLPGARIGTVDKFQGQEAPIESYSMATSTFADAPRGMEFLLQRQPLQCCHFPRAVYRGPRGVSRHLRSRVQDAATDAIGKRILSVS